MRRYGPRQERHCLQVFLELLALDGTRLPREVVTAGEEEKGSAALQRSSDRLGGKIHEALLSALRARDREAQYGLSHSRTPH